MGHETALRLLLLLLLGPSLVTYTNQAEVRGPFRGQIVDQETGRPIEGAVVLAVSAIFFVTLAISRLPRGRRAPA